MRQHFALTSRNDPLRNHPKSQARFYTGLIVAPKTPYEATAKNKSQWNPSRSEKKWNFMPYSCILHGASYFSIYSLFICFRFWIIFIAPLFTMLAMHFLFHFLSIHRYPLVFITVIFSTIILFILLAVHKFHIDIYFIFCHYLLFFVLCFQCYTLASDEATKWASLLSRGIFMQ